MNNLTKVFLILPFLLFLLPAASNANTPAKSINLSDKTDFINIGLHLEYMLDESGKLNIKDITSHKYSKRFQPSTKARPSFGITDSSCWIRFSLVNKSQKHKNWLLELAYPPLDSVKLYLKADHESFIIIKAGDLLPFNYRQRKHRNYVFPLLIGHNREITIYMEIRTESVMEIPLSIWQEAAFQKAELTEQFLFGLYYGILIVMIFYNLFIFLSIRDVSYLYYVLFIVFVILFQITFTGIAYKDIWPDSVWWNNRSIPFFIGLCALSALQFTRSFLNLKKDRPMFDKGLVILIIIFLIFIPLTLIISYSNALKFGGAITILSALTIFFAGVVRVKEGHRPAIFFLISWTVYLLGASAQLLKNVAILPSIFFTNWGVFVGAPLMVVLLSLALADKIKIIEREKKETEQKAIGIEQELKVARGIQQSILPKKLPELAGLNIGVHYLPMAILGGDFFDFHIVDDDKLGVLIADVSGHGIPAAIIAAMLKTAFSLQTSNVNRPVSVLENLNFSISGYSHNQFVTAAYIYLDLNLKKLFYASAGHWPILLRRKSENRLYELKAKGRVMCFFQEINSLTYEIDVKQGDRIILYTDGILEARNQTGELFGELRFHNLIKTLDNTSGNVFARSIIEHIVKWTTLQDKAFDDDVTIVVLDITRKLETG